MSEMVIFTRTFDLLDWLLPHCEQFPKWQRPFVTHRLMMATLDFQETLFDANAQRGEMRLARLQSATAHLNKIRLYLRLIERWHWLSVAQYEHVSRMIEEIGRLLGGWIKQSRVS